MNKLTLAILLLLLNWHYSIAQSAMLEFRQVNFEQPNDSLLKTIAQKNYYFYMGKATEAYNDQKFTNCFFYLKQAEANKMTTAQFYYLLGLSRYYAGEIAPAKRYLARGYENKNCKACLQVLEKINKIESGAK